MDAVVGHYEGGSGSPTDAGTPAPITHAPTATTHATHRATRAFNVVATVTTPSVRVRAEGDGSVGDPLPTPSVPVAASPETPVLPGHVVKIRAVVKPNTIKTPDGTYQWSIQMGMAFYGEKSQGEKFAQEECQFLADTFWSGSAPDYFVKAESRGDRKSVV